MSDRISNCTPIIRVESWAGVYVLLKKKIEIKKITSSLLEFVPLAPPPHLRKTTINI